MTPETPERMTFDEWLARWDREGRRHALVTADGALETLLQSAFIAGIGPTLSWADWREMHKQEIAALESSRPAVQEPAGTPHGSGRRTPGDRQAQSVSPPSIIGLYPPDTRPLNDGLPMREDKACESDREAQRDK